MRYSHSRNNNELVERDEYSNDKSLTNVFYCNVIVVRRCTTFYRLKSKLRRGVVFLYNDGSKNIRCRQFRASVGRRILTFFSGRIFYPVTRSKTDEHVSRSLALWIPKNVRSVYDYDHCACVYVVIVVHTRA